jgi:tetratricopeptide (TPR) repeat protein
MGSRVWIVALVLLSAASVRAQGPPSRTGVFGIPTENDVAMIAGRVLYGDGRPATAVTVQLQTSEGAPAGLESTNSSGEFSFTGIRPGRYTVMVWQAGYRTVIEVVEARGRLAGAANTLVLTLVPEGKPGAPARAAGATISVEELKIPEKARREYREGVASLTAGKQAEAASHFERAVKLYPRYAEGYIRLGLVHAEQSQFPRAKREIGKAIQLDPKNPDGYAALGFVHRKAGERAEAAAALRQAIALRESDWFAQMELGALLLEEKKPAEALPHLLRAHQLHPQLASIHLLLYNALIFLDRGRAALAELDEFLAHFPNDPDAVRLRQVRAGLARAVSEANH